MEGFYKCKSIVRGDATFVDLVYDGGYPEVPPPNNVRLTYICSPEVTIPFQEGKRYYLKTGPETH